MLVGPEDDLAGLPHEQVSILVVMDHARGRRVGGSSSWRTARSFDPCCHGSCSWASSCPRSDQASLDVSILVVMDHARGLVRLVAARPALVVSILVVMDHARGRPWRGGLWRG